MRQGSQSRDQPVLRFAVMCFFCFTSFLWHVGCRSFVESDLSIDAGDDMPFLECVEYLDRLRLGVGPGDTSGVFGQ